MAYFNLSSLLIFQVVILKFLFFIFNKLLIWNFWLTDAKLGRFKMNIINSSVYVKILILFSFVWIIQFILPSHTILTTIIPWIYISTIFLVTFKYSILYSLITQTPFWDSNPPKKNIYYLFIFWNISFIWYVLQKK